MGDTKSPIVTLITDFGEGHYAGAMKGALLEVAPEVRIVNISHQVRSHDVLEGAFTLLCSYPYFPAGSIHVVVVDPGVGSERRGIVVSAGGHHFVGPDNGVFSLVYRRQPDRSVVSISRERFFRQPVSNTFHGRDIFAPVAGWLARGTPPEDLGEQIQDYFSLPIPSVERLGPNRLRGTVLHVDKFGNIITDLSPDDVSQLEGKGSPWFQVNGSKITDHYRFYAEAPSGRPFSLVGSCGYYELAVAGQSAAQLLGIQPGARIEMELAGE